MEDKIITLLKAQVSLFRQFSADRLAKILEGSRVQTYETDEAVLRFGKKAIFLGVLLEGSISSSVVGEEGLRKEIAHFTSGDTFGEMALMSGDPDKAAAAFRESADPYGLHLKGERPEDIRALIMSKMYAPLYR
jgi:CRP-like cAMP-binding protein